MNKNKDVGYLYIKRMQGYNNTKGWYVQIERRYLGDIVIVANKLFSDKKLGGLVVARKLAIEYRNKMLKKYPPYCFSSKYQTKAQAAKNYIAFWTQKNKNTGTH